MVPENPFRPTFAPPVRHGAVKFSIPGLPEHLRDQA